MSNTVLAGESGGDPAHRRVESEPSGRDWAWIGIGVASAFALIGLYLAGIWAAWTVVEALV